MERFDSIYLFTTENIAGYMNELNLTNKKIITVTGSSDHIINAILKGCLDITTFDINQLAKYYMDLKLSAIEELSYNEFLDFLLYDTDKSFDYEIVKKLKMNEESRNFWLKELLKNNNNGKKMRNSNLFNLKYFNIQNKIECNLYLNKKNYDIIKSRLGLVKINFIHSNLKDLKVDENYDYMFLSNISDYINTFYEDNYLNNYKNLIFEFLDKVRYIYFAYIYDINSKTKRSIIDNVENVTDCFGNFKIKRVKSALLNHDSNTEDAVFIKEENKNGK